MTTLADFQNRHRAYAEEIFDAVRAISASDAPGRGVTRFGFTPKETQVMEKLVEYGRKLDLEITKDPAGNVWMTMPGEDRTLPVVMTGSHADSVFDAGNYDGLAGIAAGLVAVREMREKGLKPKRDVVVTVLRCEEQGLIGSKAMMGKITDAELTARWRPDMPTLEELMRAEGVDPAAVSTGTPVVDPKRIAGYVELHIEQGLRLNMPENPRVGLVTGIRGIIFQRTVKVTGAPGHAGAIDYGFRKDALAAAVRLLDAVNRRWAERVAMGDDLVFTVGMLNTLPNATFNKIPEEVTFSFDLRTLNRKTRDDFYAEMLAEAQKISEATGVAFDFGMPGYMEPCVSDPVLMEKLRRSAAKSGVRFLEEPSGAGHDAQTFGKEGIPFAMIFVANQNGSHNPDEAMRTDDFLEGAAVLTGLLADYDA